MFIRIIKLLLSTTFICGMSIYHVALANPIEIKDHSGKIIKLPSTPNRIVTVATLPDTMVVSLDHGPKRLVALHPSSKKAMKKSVILDFFPKLGSISGKVIGKNGVPNTEELLKLNPDIILQWTHKKKSIEAMRSAGLTVFGLKYKKKNMTTEWLSDIGTLMEKRDRADEILDWYHKIAKSIKSKTDTIDKKDRPSVIYMVRDNQFGGLSSHVHHIIEVAGGRNAAAQPKKFIDFDSEMLLKADPDIIFMHHFGTKKTPNDYYNDPIYAEMKAVKNRKIYKVPMGGARWDGPNQERGLSLEWFTRIVQGDDYLDGSLRANIKAAFPMIYGEQVNDQQIDRILMVKMNGSSTNYNKISK